MTIDSQDPAQIWQALASETFEMSRQRRSGPAGGLLPETIRIREDTTITAGRVSWQLSSRLEQGQARWQGRLDSSNLEGETRRNALDLAEADARDLRRTQGASRELVVDKLECQSNFLQAEAAGELDQMSGWATFDLNLLAAELGQFLDLKQVQLAGDGWTYIDWKRTANGRFQADGELQVREFRLASPDRRPWSEEHLLMFFSLSGQADDNRLQSVEKADLKLESKPDTLLVELREPVTNFTSTDDLARASQGVRGAGHLARAPGTVAG